MKKKLHNLYTLLTLGITLGATMIDKLRLTFFLVASRIAHQQSSTKSFFVQMNGAPVRIQLRNNYADAFVLDEAFRGNDYALPLSKDPSVIFDLGANLGFVAISFALRYPQARIYCFEPDPENFAECVANTAAFPNIVCFPYAVGARKETRYFYKSPVFHMRNSLISRSANDERIEVKVIPLEEAMTLAAVSQVDLMKFDVEGAETEIFSAFSRFSALRAIVGEIHPYLWKGNEEAELLETLRKHFAITLRAGHEKTFLSGTAL
ncbi:MAG: FkbM family methyltransferase [Candidatus Kaiserbacteria bacterium]|nr:FkbM family methyltransferase [Candidatus Kaiserbacteria bacterium]